MPRRLAAALPPVVLPHLWLALALELSRGPTGGDWTAARRWPDAERPRDGALPHAATPLWRARHGHAAPQVLLDGTGDEELLALLFEMDVLMLRAKARSAA